jgi:hypothetical protein
MREARFFLYEVCFVSHLRKLIGAFNNSIVNLFCANT